MDHLRPLLLCDVQCPYLVDARAQMSEAIVGRQRLRHAASILACSAWSCALYCGGCCWRTGDRRVEVEAAEAMFECAGRVRRHASCIDGDIYWRRRCRVDPTFVIAWLLINNNIVRLTGE
jgi:hypothetical protein